jgi:hypothetical protein
VPYLKIKVQTFPYKNISIAFSDEGQGTVIVLLHVFLENQSIWQKTIKSLKNFKYK